MKPQLLAIISAATLAACAPRDNITLRFEGLDNDTVLLSRYVYADYMAGNADRSCRQDTLLLENGTVSLHADIERPEMLVATPMQYVIEWEGEGRYPDASGSVTFFLRKGERATIDARSANGYVEAEARGSRLNRDITAADNDIRAIFKLYSATGRAINRSIAEKGNVPDELNDRMRTLADSMMRLRIEFIEAHPDREASAYMISQIGGAQAEKYYRKVDKRIFAATFAPLEERLLRYIETERIRTEAAERIAEGADAPDFTLKDIDGNDVSLADFKGRWIVLDFWGSWCGWCIKDFPELKEFHRKHRDRMEIIGIACNDSDERWREAVAKYGLPWTNVINPMDARPAMSLPVIYAVNAYPTKIIITPQGTIHKIFVGESPAFYAEAEKILR